MSRSERVKCFNDQAQAPEAAVAAERIADMGQKAEAAGRLRETMDSAALKKAAVYRDEEEALALFEGSGPDAEALKYLEEHEWKAEGYADDMDEDESDETQSYERDSLPPGEELYYAQIRDIPILSEEEEHALAVRAVNGEKEAADQLIWHNLRYAFKIACRYVGMGLSKEDLIQEANMGLIKAVERYDPDSGYRFTTYATWWVRQKINRALNNHARTVRLPVHIAQSIIKLNKMEREISLEVNGSDQEKLDALIMERTGWSERKLKELRRNRVDIVSLNSYVDNDGEQESELMDFVADERAVPPEDAAMRSGLVETLDLAFKKVLTKRERDVLTLRFGLYGERPHTLEKTGEIFGVTRERIRQIEAAAMRKLRSCRYTGALKSFTTTSD